MRRHVVAYERRSFVVAVDNNAVVVVDMLVDYRMQQSMTNMTSVVTLIVVATPMMVVVVFVVVHADAFRMANVVYCSHSHSCLYRLWQHSVHLRLAIQLIVLHRQLMLDTIDYDVIIANIVMLLVACLHFDIRLLLRLVDRSRRVTIKHLSELEIRSIYNLLYCRLIGWHAFLHFRFECQRHDDDLQVDIRMAHGVDIEIRLTNVKSFDIITIVE